MPQQQSQRPVNSSFKNSNVSLMYHSRMRYLHSKKKIQSQSQQLKQEEQETDKKIRSRTTTFQTNSHKKIKQHHTQRTTSFPKIKQPCNVDILLPPTEIITRRKAFRFACLKLQSENTSSKLNNKKAKIKKIESLLYKEDPNFIRKRDEIYSRFYSSSNDDKDHEDDSDENIDEDLLDDESDNTMQYQNDDFDDNVSTISNTSNRKTNVIHLPKLNSTINDDKKTLINQEKQKNQKSILTRRNRNTANFGMNDSVIITTRRSTRNIRRSLINFNTFDDNHSIAGSSMSSSSSTGSFPKEFAFLSKCNDN